MGKTLSYEAQVLAKIWSIVKPDEEAEYDTNNLYDLICEGVEARKAIARHLASRIQATVDARQL